MSSGNIAVLTGIAMIAFAANSVLCRVSLGTDLIDAASFTTVRLLSGAVCLLLIVSIQEKNWRPTRPDWPSVLALYVYMICFSYAYRSLSTGTGALLLFGFVQLTMIGTAIYRGERLKTLGWTGLLIATGGLIYLVLPGVEAPDPKYAALMAIAGLAWGAYSLLGIRGDAPTSSTANNFLYATPLAVLFSILDSNNLHITWQGGLLGIASGAIASGLGYAIWYTALKHIRATTAAIVQLSVPALATLGGVILLGELLTLRIVFATMLTLGGVAIFLARPTSSR
jgi:drug/metabolite transporter (DMT)-like permease